MSEEKDNFFCFNFVCPKCSYIITEKDFLDNNSKILKYFQKFFNKNKSLYIKEIKENFLDNINKKFDSKINFLLVKKELEIEKLKQKEINILKLEISKLNEKINNYELKKNNELNIQKNIFLVEKQKIINDFNEKLLKEQLKFSNTKSEIDKNNLKKENLFIEKIKILNNKIHKLEIANMQSKIIQNKIKGENFEYEIEFELRKTFSEDNIKKITDKSKKADYIQEVKYDNKIIGKIVYELKNAEWNNNWEKKMIDDISKQNAKYGILISTSFSSQFKGIPFKVSDENSNIFLTDLESFYFVGHILRTLIKTEYKIELLKGENKYKEKIINFNKWRDFELPKINKLFDENIKKIFDSELYMLKKIEDIKKSRENIINCWTNAIKNFIKNFSL